MDYKISLSQKWNAGANGVEICVNVEPQGSINVINAVVSPALTSDIAIDEFFDKLRAILTPAAVAGVKGSLAKLQSSGRQ